MKRRYSCPECGGRETIKKGKRRGCERRLCNSCGKWFSLNRRSRTSARELANLHLSGMSFRRLADTYDLSPSTAFRKVAEYLKDLPHNADVTREYSSKFSGILVLDGKYLNIGKGNSSLVWGVDYLNHDIPTFKLAPFENYPASISYFQSLRLLNYPLSSLVVDDNISFKLAAKRVYPKVVIQTCTNHYKENIRKSLFTRTQEKYQPFIRQIENLFKTKRANDDYHQRANKIYKTWQDDQLARAVLLDMAKREGELRAWTKVKHTPQTTNLIESYNKHLKARVKPLQGFQTVKQAKLWINAYILKRRTTPFTDCKGRFKKLNGHSSLELTLQDNKTLPNFF